MIELSLIEFALVWYGIITIWVVTMGFKKYASINYSLGTLFLGITLLAGSV